MEKETEKKSSGLLQNQWLLFLLATALLSAAYWFEAWPLLAFVALIPCFAFTDHPKATEKIWEIAEFLLFAFGIALYFGYALDLKFIFPIVGLAALYTLPFILFILSRMASGPLTGHFILIFFWLASEYMLLKLLAFFQWTPGAHPVFLADLFLGRPEWLNWNSQTGYLAASAWILMANWLGYRLVSRPFHWIHVIIYLVIVVGPLASSFWLTAEPITRTEMFSLYASDSKGESGYAMHGEWIGRTAAWVSALVLLFSVIRNKTKKK